MSKAKRKSLGHRGKRLRNRLAKGRKRASPLDKWEWFFGKKVFLFDLDGTLYLGKSVLPGARDLIDRLRALNKKIFFFTNNSSRNERDYVRKLSGMGFSCESHEIVMSTHTLIHFLQIKKMKRIFLLGTPSMKEMLEEGALTVLDAESAETPDAVVVGFDKTLTYEKLFHAARLIHRGVPWIVTHPDFFCPTDEGPEPDCGAMAKLLELSTKTTPFVTLGKPHPSMIQIALERAKASVREAVLVGDRIMTDLAMAERVKMDFLLVLTGETKGSDLKKLKTSSRVRVARSLREVGLFP